jgi:nitrogen fixation protein FixH
MSATFIGRLSVKQLTGKHVLTVCLGFFGVMLAVNVLFVFLAVSTFNGGEGGKAYQTGIEYNRTIESAREQERLGWSHRIEAAAAGQITVAVADRRGEPITGLTLAGDIGRPVADKFNRPLAFSEVRPGSYAARTDALDAGNWVVSIAAHAATGKPAAYRIKERLWLKPNS